MNAILWNESVWCNYWTDNKNLGHNGLYIGVVPMCLRYPATLKPLPRHLCFMVQWFCLTQDQDSLLVKRRNDNHSPGPVIRELVPSSHQRSELSNTILCIFSRWDQRIGEGVPIPDSLGEEATFINICISNGSLKCHRVLISTTPSFGDKVICWYTGITFKTFI